MTKEEEEKFQKRLETMIRTNPSEFYQIIIEISEELPNHKALAEFAKLARKDLEKLS